MMAGSDLVVWLRAQLDEDERRARHVPSAAPWTLSASATLELDEGDSVYLVDRRVADHIVWWSPARVVAEVEAKRRILDLHRLKDMVGEGMRCRLCGFSFHVDPSCLTVRLLALPYADRPGFREEWRP